MFMHDKKLLKSCLIHRKWTLLLTQVMDLRLHMIICKHKQKSHQKYLCHNLYHLTGQQLPFYQAPSSICNHDNPPGSPGPPDDPGRKAESSPCNVGVSVGATDVFQRRRGRASHESAFRWRQTLTEVPTWNQRKEETDEPAFLLTSLHRVRQNSSKVHSACVCMPVPSMQSR